MESDNGSQINYQIISILGKVSNVDEGIMAGYKIQI